MRHPALVLSGTFGILIFASVGGFAQQSATARRVACERDTIAALANNHSSGVEVLIPDMPRDKVDAVISRRTIDADLKTACQNYIIQTHQFHPGCPCPL